MRQTHVKSLSRHILFNDFDVPNTVATQNAQWPFYSATVAAGHRRMQKATGIKYADGLSLLTASRKSEEIGEYQMEFR